MYNFSFAIATNSATWKKKKNDSSGTYVHSITVKQEFFLRFCVSLILSDILKHRSSVLSQLLSCYIFSPNLSRDESATHSTTRISEKFRFLHFIKFSLHDLEAYLLLLLANYFKCNLHNSIWDVKIKIFFLTNQQMALGSLCLQLL